MTLDIGKLVLNVAKLGATFERRQKRARDKTQPSTKPCSYCGAPGGRER